MPTEQGSGFAPRNREQQVPACPVCGAADKVILYGTQDYLIGGGSAPSLLFRCKGCNFNFRRFERPLSEIVSHFTFAPYSTEDVEQRWLRRREGFYHFLLGLLKEPCEGESLLDVGCGFGHFLDCAAARGYASYGTEVSEEMADLARNRGGHNVSTKSLDDLQLPEDRFDAITFVDSFYYFEGPVTVLQQCRKLLKPGGELLMRVTNRNHMAKFHRFILAVTLRGKRLPEMPFWTTDDAVSCHSRRSLTRLMETTGFRITKLTCIERGKRIDSLGLRMFYAVTNTLAFVTGERICFTPGLICLAVVQ